MDVDAARDEGQGHPARADSQLERPPAPRQCGEKLRRLLGIRTRRVEHVVDGGDPIAIGRRLVALHPESLSPRSAQRHGGRGRATSPLIPRLPWCYKEKG